MINSENRTVKSLSELLKTGEQKDILDAIIDLYSSNNDLGDYEPFGIELAYYVMDFFIHGDYEGFIYLSDSSAKVLNIIGTTTTIQRAYEIQATKYYIFDDLQSSIEVMEKFYYFALVNNLTNIINVAIGNLTTLQLKLKDYSTAFKTLSDWKIILADSHDTSDYSWHYNINMARYHLETNDAELSLPYLLNTINDKDINFIISNKIEAYTLMGHYYEKIDNHTTSLEWYKKAIHLVESEEQSISERDIYKNIADVLYRLGDYKASADYRNKYVEIIEQVLTNYKKLLKSNTELEVYLRHKELESMNLLKINEEFTHQKNTDYLTGAYNRRYINDLISDRFQDNGIKKQTLCLLLFDIDHFKDINDTYGRTVGDEVLRQLCLLINGYLPNKYTFGRHGGDEFVLIFEDITLDDAFNISDKLKLIVRKHAFNISTHQINITISGGLSSSKELGINSSTKLYDHADQRLYFAKNAGGDFINCNH